MAAELTSRQREILELFLSGMTYREVAAEAGIAPETVNPTLKACAAKLGVGGIGREVLKAGFVGVVQGDGPSSADGRMRETGDAGAAARADGSHEG